jgi:hypothetical protein
MEPESSVSYSQKPTNCPYPEPDKSNPQLPTQMFSIVNEPRVNTVSNCPVEGLENLGKQSGRYLGFYEVKVRLSLCYN